MRYSETHETRQLSTPASEQSLGLLVETPDHRVKVTYRRSATGHGAGVSLGLILGALIMAAVWAYGLAVLGGATLAALIVIAVWNASRGE